MSQSPLAMAPLAPASPPPVTLTALQVYFLDTQADTPATGGAAAAERCLAGSIAAMQSFAALEPGQRAIYQSQALALSDMLADGPLTAEQVFYACDVFPEAIRQADFLHSPDLMLRYANLTDGERARYRRQAALFTRSAGRMPSASAEEECPDDGAPAPSFPC